MNYNFTLPLPPTKNQIHEVSGSRIYLSQKARDWYKEAGMMVLSQCKGSRKPLKGDTYVGVHYLLSRDRDLDSGELLFDLLEKMQIVEDDRQITFMNVGKSEEKREPRVEIEVRKL